MKNSIDKYRPISVTRKVVSYSSHKWKKCHNGALDNKVHVLEFGKHVWAPAMICEQCGCPRYYNDKTKNTLCTYVEDYCPTCNTRIYFDMEYIHNIHKIMICPNCTQELYPADYFELMGYREKSASVNFDL